MCVNKVGPITITKRTRHVYKVVRRRTLQEFISMFSPVDRTAQDHSGYDRGTTLVYRLNEPITSSMNETPGLYCYVHLSKLKYIYPILRCRVPAGTRVRKCRSADGHTALLVETLIPIEVAAP